MSGHWHNPGLFAAMMAYCLDVFAMWRHLYPNEQSTPRRPVQRIRFEGNSFGSAQEIHLDTLRLVFDDRIRDPKQIASRPAVEEALRADGVIARHLNTLVGTLDFSSRVTIDDCLRGFLGELLIGRDALQFDERQFTQTYAAMEKFFYSDTVALRFFAPLVLFEMEGNQIQLGDRFSLIRLSAGEREELVFSGRDFLGFGFGQGALFVGSEKFGFELLMDVPKVFGEQPPPRDSDAIPQARASLELQEALSALRLFKSGYASSRMVRQTTAGWHPWMGGALMFGLNTPILGQPYNLSLGEVGAFATFWQEYRQARSRDRPRIDLALRRLNSGYERTHPEDRLIDYVIGLEALLTRKGGEGSDLAYRLALRGARLLGNDATHRAHIHADLTRAYRLRNDIVHGSEKEVSQNVTVEQETIAFGDFIERIAQHLRDAIKKFMTRTVATRELEVIKALDREAIIGS